MRTVLAVVALALVVVVPATHDPLVAADDTVEARYELPEGFERPEGTEFDDPDGLTARAIETLLGRGSTWDRNTARRTLAALGDFALPRIVEALRSGGRRERGRLMRALAEMRTPHARSLLVAASGDDLWQVRRDAAHGLGQIPGAPPLEALLARIDDREWPVRAAAVTSLGRIIGRLEADQQARVRGAIASHLDDPDDDVRQTARRTLVRLGAVEVIPSLIVLGDSLNEAERDEALAHLWALRRQKGFAGDALARFLHSRIESDERARALIAAAILARLEPDDLLDIPRVREDVAAAALAFSGEDTVWARRIVEQIGRPSVAFLRKTLASASGIRINRHPDARRDNRAGAQRVLEWISQVGGRATIPDFAAMIRESHDDVLIGYAVRIATELFPAEIVGPAIERYDASGNYRIKARLLRVLSRLAPAEATPRLRAAAESGQFDLQYAVIDVIERGDRTEDEVHLLRGIIAHTSSFRVIGRAAKLLVMFVEEEAEATVLPALESDDLQIRRVIAKALGSGRWRSEAAANALRAAYDASAPNDDDDESTAGLKIRVRDASLQAVRVRRRHKDPTFIARALTDPWPAVRIEAARLGRKTKRPDVAAVLIAALDTEEEDAVREALVSVLATSSTDAAHERIEAMIAGDSRADLVRALSALSSSDGPLPAGILENLVDGGWDEDLVRRVASVVAQRGDQAALDLLAARLDDAPYETADAILSALQERGADRVVPQLLAMLPSGDSEIGELDQDLLLLLVETIGQTGDDRAVGPLRELLEKARLADPERRDRAWLDAFAGEIAKAFAELAPSAALDPVLGLILDPAIAERAWADERETNSHRLFRHAIPQPVDRAVSGLRRASDAKIATALEGMLSARRRTGELFSLPASHFAGLQERFLEWRVSKRPRPAAANRIAFEIVRHPPRASYEVLDAATRLAHVSLSRGKGAKARAYALEALDALRRDPEQRFAGEKRDSAVAELVAIRRMAEGLIDRTTEGGEERCLETFQQTTDARPHDAYVATLVALYGNQAGLAKERVAAWASRAYALSAGQSDDDRYHALYHVGWIRHCHGDSLAGAALLRRADTARLRDPVIPYRRAIIAMSLDRPERALELLKRAFAVNDTLFDEARTESAFVPLRADDRLAKLIADAESSEK